MWSVWNSFALSARFSLAHTIRPERYTILGDNGISEDAAYELALKTGVIK